jgi:hypothetical protein
MGSEVGRERAAMLGVLALAALGGILALARPPSAAPHETAEQALDLIRVLSTVALALALLLGPGIGWRLLARGEQALPLGFLPLPGLLLLIVTGGLAWLLAGQVDPRLTCFALLAPVLGLLAGCLVGAEPAEVFEADERRALLIVGAVLGVAVGRALWSLGPPGELYAGGVSRTLEVGDRPDSRVPFIVPQLIAHDGGPYGSLANLFYAPYNFSSRGPLPGLGSTPLVLMAGGRPPAAFADQPWAPFDPQGFMAFRLAMMTFACTAFLSLWDLVRRIAGTGAARFALLLAATTPFLVHEVWFTWPKLLAASMVLLAAICTIGRRPLVAGALAGLGYLMHPVALLSVPVLALLTLWPLRGAALRSPHLRQGVLLGAGLGAFLLAWRLLNGDHYSQTGFLDYLTAAGWDFHPDPATWLSFRVKSVASTLVPLLLPLVSADNPSVNMVGGTSPTSVHFFFQYWTGLPFGIAIVFFPFLLISLWRAWRRWPWPLFATVLVPFALFAVYWGASTTGMLREGLQAWVLTLVAVVACQQAAERFGWLRSIPTRALLALRAAELLAVAVGPTALTGHALLSGDHTLTDVVALAAMVGFSAFLGTLVWRARPDQLAVEG